MVQVSKKLVLEFQQILKEDYGKELSFAETSEIANGLIGYLTLAAEIYARDETLRNKIKKLKKKKKNEEKIFTPGRISKKVQTRK